MSSHFYIQISNKNNSKTYLDSNIEKIITSEFIIRYKKIKPLFMHKTDDLIIFILNKVHTNTKLNYLKNVDICERFCANYEKSLSNPLRFFDFRYSVIVCDIKQQQLHIKSDDYGKKPIYFKKNNEGCVFSSDINFLIQKSDRLKIDNIKVSEFLQLVNNSSERTFFSEIRKIKTKSIYVYSILENLISSSMISNKKNCNSSNDGSKVFEKLSSNSVFKNLDKEKLGLIYSGGLDSSAVLAAMSSNDIGKVRTYSMIFSNLPSKQKKRADEQKFQHIGATYYDVDHSEIDGSDINPIDDIFKAQQIINQPIFFPNIYLFFLICEKAKKDGIEKIFTGIGGDSSISWGYEALREYFFTLKIKKFYSLIKVYSEKRKLKLKFIFNSIIRLFIHEKLKYYINAFFGRFKIYFGINNIMSEDFIKKTQIYKKIYLNLPFTSKKYHKYMINAVDHEMNNEKLFHIFNNYDIEHFMPFYDEDLIDYCSNVDLNYKLKDGYERSYFRKALIDKVPRIILERQEKGDLGKSFMINFLKEGKGIVFRELDNLHPYLEKIINKRHFAHELNSFERMKYNDINESCIVNIYNLFALNKWLHLNNSKITF